MTFGEIKSIIEESLIDSYKDSKNFKNVLGQFQNNVLSNKSLSKLYYIYDDLTSKKGLNESDAKEYLEEGIQLIRRIIKESKLPKFSLRNVENKYEDLDTLVYSNNINISERLEARKKLVKTLSESKQYNNVKVDLPLTSMVSIANQTLNKFVDNLDESSKKDFLYVLKEDQKTLKTKFTSLKEETIEKLKSHLKGETEEDLKLKIEETIKRLKNEEFNQINFVRLKNLQESI